MKKKVIHIISDVGKSHHLEWLTLQIKDHYDLKVLLIGKAKTFHEEFLRVQNVPTLHVPYNSKTDFFNVIKSVFRFIKKEKPQLVHTHFWFANIVGIPISYLLSISHRVMTRHHGNLHHQFYKKGVWMDVVLNKLSTIIISPTEGIRNLMVHSEYTSPDKIKVINHGIDCSYYRMATTERVQIIRNRYSIPVTFPIIGVISRHIEWKGIQYIIPAFKELIKQVPTAHLILANTNGDYRNVLIDMLNDIPKSTYTLIEYENDAAGLYSIFDFFVHVPIGLYSESFGLIYIEALAAGKPSVFTLSGVAPDFIRHECNALVVDYKDADQIRTSVLKLLSDKELVNKMEVICRVFYCPWQSYVTKNKGKYEV